MRAAHPRRLLAGLALAATSACASGGSGGPLPPDDPALIAFAPELGVDLAQFEETDSGLYYKDVVVGTGRTASRRSLVRVFYVGWLPDGSVFEALLDGEPYQFELDGGGVIRGWVEGIQGMRVGGRRKLVIRPGLAYGSRGQGPVPPGATLVFEIQLVDAN